MIKPIAIALIVLSLTACITVEIPAPDYPEIPEMDELSEVSDAADKASDAVSVSAKTKSGANVTERSTPRPADTPRPAATARPVNSRPDTSQMLVIGSFSNNNLGISISEMFQMYESNIHFAEKVFDDKWIWLAGPYIERVERNRLLVYSNGERRLYARFSPNAGLEDVEVLVTGLLCFGPTYIERNDLRTLTISDCEIIDNPLDLD